MFDDISCYTDGKVLYLVKAVLHLCQHVPTAEYNFSYGHYERRCLFSQTTTQLHTESVFPYLVSFFDAELDCNLCPLPINTLQMTTLLNPSRFEHFFKWNNLMQAVACLIHIAQLLFKSFKSCWHLCCSTEEIKVPI